MIGALWAGLGLWRLAVYAAVVAALLGAGWRIHHNIWQDGYDSRDSEAKTAEVLALVNNGRIQQDMQQDANDLGRKKDVQIRTINARLADALGDYSMLQRATQRRGSDLPQDSGSCAGGTGAGLSGPDAGFLNRESARANLLRAALDTCQQRYQAVQRAQPQALTPSTTERTSP